MTRATEDRPRRRGGEIDELVCAILTKAARPLSAYDLAARASDAGRRVVSAQIYRTLARLVRQRRALRIEMLAAYVPYVDAANLCLVCLGCRGVQMIRDEAIRSVEAEAAGRRFHLAAAPMEAAGWCDACMDRRRTMVSHEAGGAPPGAARRSRRQG